MSTVIRVENVWKQYRLGVFGHRMLVQDFQSWLARVKGKEDPNAPIGSGRKERDTAGERVWALKGVSFEVEEGQVLGIIGRNGAGKSTLLKIISRVTAPTKGIIKIKGRVASLLEVGTGFHPELTGRENVFLNGAILGMTEAEIRRKFDEIVDFSGVEQYIDTPVKRYSSGMRVRLAFAVAAHLEPEILVIDEVLAVGDAEFQRKCLRKMDEVASGGRTILFVSHNLGSIQHLCMSGICLDNGTISLRGSIGQVVGAYYDSLECPSGEATIAPNDKKQVFIRHAALLNQNGQVVSEIDMRSPFGIQVIIEGSLEKAILSLKINNELNDNITVASTRRSLRGDLTLNSNTITCWFSENRLMHGHHTVSIWLGTLGNCAEWLPHRIRFLVKPEDIFGTQQLMSLRDHGGFFLHHTWEIS